MDGRRNRKERQWSSQRLLVLFNLTLIYPKKKWRNRKERQWSSQRLLVLFNLTLIYPKKKKLHEGSGFVRVSRLQMY